MLCLCEILPQFHNFKSEISNLKLRGENIAKQLHGWIGSLKNSEIKGVKFLTEKERARLQMVKDDKEFRDALQRQMRGEKIDWSKF
jgi:hypothetical protein